VYVKISSSSTASQTLIREKKEGGVGGRKIQTKIAILQSSLSQLLKQGTETSGFLNHWFRPMERFVTGQPHQTEHQTTQSALGTRETRSTKHFQREVTHNY